MSTGELSPGARRGRRLLIRALDAALILILVTIFAVGREPDVLFHVMWVVLVIQAFVFGLRTALVRLAFGTTGLLVYWQMSSSHIAVPVQLGELELSEWPLMFVIALLVAVMADRQGSAGRHYAALYRGASERLMSAQEDERRRLARDLHDGVGQTLTALMLNLDAAESMLWAGPTPPPSQGRATLRRAQELAADAVEDVRDVAHRLQPSRITEVGLVAAIRDLASRAGLPVRVTAAAELQRPGLLAPAVEIEVYRIVQEAIGNAARHAHATVVEVAIRASEGLRIEVVDDGVGIAADAAESRGLGLVGMLERTDAIGGRLAIESVPGRGTTVRLWVPNVADEPSAVATVPATSGAVGTVPEQAGSLP